MTLAEELQDKLQLWKEAISSCKVAEPDEKSRKDESYNHAGIPLATKLCYAIGGIPYQATNIALGFSFQIFLLDVVQMEVFFVSLILFVTRVWDAVTDPLVGYLVSRSGRTPIGKLLPWSVLSMPLGILSYVLLWFIPHAAHSSSVGVPWYLIISCLFQTLMSCYHVPYMSLNMFLGGSERDRDSATAYRMSAEVLSMLLAAVMQGQVLRVYNREREDSCTDTDNNDELTYSTSSPSIASLQNTRAAFMTSALLLGALFFLCCMVLFLGVREQSGPASVQIERHSSYLADLKKLIGHVSYQRLVLGFLFTSLAFQMALGNFALFCIHVAGLGAQFQYLILAILVSATVSVPLWQMILLRLGKKSTLFIGLPIFIPVMIVLASVSENFPVYMIMCILVGTSVATLFLLPWSMLPDVVDEFMVANPCCRAMEPLFFSCYCFCNKLGGGLSAGISTMTLHLTGYKTGACSHSGGVVLALRLLLAPIPIILLLVGLVFFYLYPINEMQRRRIQQDQEQTRVKSQMLPNKEDVKLQQCTTKRSSFRSKTSTISSSSRVKNSSSQLRCFPSTSVQKHWVASTSPPDRNASLDCTAEPPFYKPKWRSKSNLPVSQISTPQSSLKSNETCSKRAVVTWV
ncbi:sodium-dependent lysophosphatidylcholine symporter 1-B-like [Pangasianodon hypophthalmus]|uniref:sodium-dependent lysophosphatidylcholine symporter 1-B-like n=1 Tax=Pangasianodon hypophthalmus TaxID=310915 RepID=UPI002306FE2C|nr:sodium-dependent lysophosphatidylcholine symporter 1-B-like [Pangasianodon hypophthalmus]